MSKEIKQLEHDLLAKPKAAVTKFAAKDLLSSGSTLLNLACTGKPNGAYLKGGLYSFVGDSSAGKTMLALTALAEAASNPAFDDYRLIFDDSENGALMDWVRFFGRNMADRIEQPNDKGPSNTVEEFYYFVDDAVQKGTPFIYIKDSMDSLNPEEEIKKFRSNKRASQRGADEDKKGSYGTAKAKANSSGMRLIHNGLRKTSSILIALSQTRDKIGGFGFGPQKTRSGGYAQTFYAQLEVWFSVREKIKKTVKGLSMELGTLARIRVKKNRLLGRDRTVDVPIFHSTGVSDIDSMVDFLVERKHWGATVTKAGDITSVEAGDWDIKLPYEKLVHLIQDQGREKELKALVAEVWNEIESECAMIRKNKYQ